MPSTIEPHGGSPRRDGGGASARSEANLARDLNRISEVAIRRGHIAQGMTHEALMLIEGMGRAASVALPMAADLSDAEAHFAAIAPSGAHRYRAIADAFTAAVVNEILNLGNDR